MGSTAILRKAVRTPALNAVGTYYSISLNRPNLSQNNLSFSAGGTRSSETLGIDAEHGDDAVLYDGGLEAPFGFNPSPPPIGLQTFSSVTDLVPELLQYSPQSTPFIQGLLYNGNNTTPGQGRPATASVPGFFQNNGLSPFNVGDWPYGTTPSQASSHAAWVGGGSNATGDFSDSQYGCPEGLSITPPRPFQCFQNSAKKHSENHICGQSFLQQKDLARHLRTVHASEGEPVYRCKCGSRCIRKDNHLRHVENCARQPDPSFPAYYSCRCGIRAGDKDDHTGHVRECNHGFRRRGRPPTRTIA